MKYYGRISGAKQLAKTKREDVTINMKEIKKSMSVTKKKEEIYKETIEVLWTRFRFVMITSQNVMVFYHYYCTAKYCVRGARQDSATNLRIPKA